MIAWLALRLRVQADAADPFSDALLEAGAESTSIDADGTTVHALIGKDADARVLVERAAALCSVSPPPFSASDVEDRDWVRLTQSQFEPVVLDRLWIGPSWREPPADGSAIMRLDPGLAFGTGSHPSTRLVLRYLTREVRGGESVLDYGCGSGILAIAAAKLGATRVDAVDIDPQSVETAVENARANGVSVRVSSPDALEPRAYDIVIANILAQPLVVLAPILIARAKGGRLALSGLLDSQSAEVAAAYDPAARLLVGERDGEWVLLEGRVR